MGLVFHFHVRYLINDLNLVEIFTSVDYMNMPIYDDYASNNFFPIKVTSYGKKKSF